VLKHAESSLAEPFTPSQLSNAIGALLGQELHRVLSKYSRGLDFEGWLLHVADAAADAISKSLERIAEGVEDDKWLVNLRLLAGLAGQAPPRVVEPVIDDLRVMQQELRFAIPDRIIKLVPNDRFLLRLVQPHPTGHIWSIREPNSPRIGYVIQLHWHIDNTYSYYLQTVDICGLPWPGSSWEYKELEDAFAAWAKQESHSAESKLDIHKGSQWIQPLLDCVPQHLPDMVDGDEPLAYLNGWFRLRCILDSLWQDSELVNADVPITPDNEAIETKRAAEQACQDFANDIKKHDRLGIFTTPCEPGYCDNIEDHPIPLSDLWHAWFKDCAGGAETLLTPHRVDWARGYLVDHAEEEDLVKELLAYWVEFFGYRFGYPEEVVSKCVEVVYGNSRDSADCPGYP